MTRRTVSLLVRVAVEVLVKPAVPLVAYRKRDKIMTTNRDKRNRFLIWMAIGIGTICIAGVLILRPTRARDNPDSTLGAFAEALRLNNERTVQKYVAPAQQDRLEVWMAKREGFRCPFSWQYSLDPDYHKIFWTHTPCSYAGTTVECYDYSFWCAYPGGSYSFWIENVIIQPAEGQYQVVAWETICEKFRGEDKRCE